MYKIYFKKVIVINALPNRTTKNQNCNQTKHCQVNLFLIKVKLTWPWTVYIIKQWLVPTLNL